MPVFARATFRRAGVCLRQIHARSPPPRPFWLGAGPVFATLLRPSGTPLFSARAFFRPASSVRPLPRGKFLPALAAVFLAALAPARAQVVTAVASGNWSDGATWAG